MMENDYTASASSSSSMNHGHNIHSKHRLDQTHQSHSHHELIPSSSLLIILLPIIIIVLLLAILLLVAMLRRLHFSRANTNGDTAASVTSSKRIVHNSNCMFIAHSTINLDPTSDGGCLYGNSVVGDTPQMRGFQVQVFTLKEAEKATNNFSDANLVHKGALEPEKATNNFSDANLVHKGASAAVYRGVLGNGTPVAIKILRANGRSAERAFRSEVDLLCRVRSPYISELLGYCADQSHRLLVFEYMPNGTLSKHLHFRLNQGGSLKWAVRLKIALDCARALEYLHEHMTPSIIHRNFKSTSILLDHNFRAKLSGFGLAKIGSDKLNGLISTRVLGTTGYLAPEYASTGKLTTKSDVYSYGVILLELLTGRVPVDTSRPPGEHVLVSWALPRLTNRDKVMEMIDPALQGHYSKKDLIQVAAIAAMCVQTEADYRPLITDVVQSLMPLVKNHSLPGSSGFGHTPSPSPKL